MAYANPLTKAVADAVLASTTDFLMDHRGEDWPEDSMEVLDDYIIEVQATGNLVVVVKLTPRSGYPTPKYFQVKISAIK